MCSTKPGTETMVSVNTMLNTLPSLRSTLFQPEADKPYSALKVEDVKTAIEQNEDVRNFKVQFAQAFGGFADRLHQQLIDHVKEVRELQAQDEISTDIFRRLNPVPLIDRYAVYQALADHWQSIIIDIETIQEEGIRAVREVETVYKLVKKKNDEEVEVPDGLKGRIIPFSLVQQMKFQAELQAIANLQSRVEAINGELDELRDSFTEEEMEAYCDSEKDNALDKKKITADAKPKADVESETKDKLKQMVALWNEQSKADKQIKADKQALEEKTIEAIRNLTDEEVAQLLHMKWIDPICEGIDSTLRSVLADLESAALALSEKYAVSYKQINDDMAVATGELAELVDQLTGDEFAIKGLKELVKE